MGSGGRREERSDHRPGKKTWGNIYARRKVTLLSLHGGEGQRKSGYLVEEMETGVKPLRLMVHPEGHCDISGGRDL